MHAKYTTKFNIIALFALIEDKICFGFTPAFAPNCKTDFILRKLPQPNYQTADIYPDRSVFY